MEVSKSKKNYYKVLGVQPNATSAEIDAAYKKISTQWHPDKNKEKRQEAEKKFHEISEAYDVLSNKNRRSHYDDISHRQFSNEDAEKTFERFFEQHGMEDESQKKFFDQFYPDRRKDYYEILGVPKNASLDQIKKSYRKLALKFNPKSNPNNPQARHKFNEVNQAYNALSTEARRHNYDLMAFGTIAPFRAHNIFEDFWGSRLNELDDDEFLKPMLRNKWSRDLDKWFEQSEASSIKNGESQKTSVYYTNNNGIQSKKSVSSKTKYVNGVPFTETTQEYQFPDGNKEVRKIKDDGNGNVTSKVYNLKKGQNLPIEN